MGQNARQTIQEELSYFNNLGVGFEWKVYSYDKPEHLKDILEEEGFFIEPQEALMVLDVTKMPPLSQMNELRHFKGNC